MEMVNFTGVTASISLEVYILILLTWCALVILFALIDNVRSLCEKIRWCTDNGIVV
jgi:hypothetical protein